MKQNEHFMVAESDFEILQGEERLTLYQVAQTDMPRIGVTAVSQARQHLLCLDVLNGTEIKLPTVSGHPTASRGTLGKQFY